MDKKHLCQGNLNFKIKFCPWFYNESGRNVYFLLDYFATFRCKIDQIYLDNMEN